MSWELVGENCEAMYHPGLLPLDWHTKAKALLAYAGEVDRWAAQQSLATAQLRHGVECHAPPGEWYGGTFITWSDQGDAPEGWWTVGEHGECVDPDDPNAGECANQPDILCLHLDEHYESTMVAVCAAVSGMVDLVTAGEGWPWFSRVIGPVTVLVL